jgi:hypothetical protein
MTKGSVNFGGIVVSRVAGGNDKLEAGFATYSLSNLVRSWGGGSSGSIGACVAYEELASSLSPKDPVQESFLSTGSQLTLTAHGDAINVPVTSTGFYTATLATEPSVYIEPGQFVVENGSGGSQVSAFQWTLTLPDPVVPTNIPPSINRADELTLTWTGGANFSVVSIFLFSGVPVATSETAYVEILCTAEASSGKFTIPSAALELLSPSGFGTQGKPGVDVQIAGVPLMRFTGDGLDAGVFSVFVSNGSVAKVL